MVQETAQIFFNRRDCWKYPAIFYFLISPDFKASRYTSSEKFGLGQKIFFNKELCVGPEEETNGGGGGMNSKNGRKAFKLSKNNNLA